MVRLRGDFGRARYRRDGPGRRGAPAGAYGEGQSRALALHGVFEDLEARLDGQQFRPDQMFASLADQPFPLPPERRAAGLVVEGRRCIDQRIEHDESRDAIGGDAAAQRAEAAREIVVEIVVERNEMRLLALLGEAARQIAPRQFGGRRAQPVDRGNGGEGVVDPGREGAQPDLDQLIDQELHVL